MTSKRFGHLTATIEPNEDREGVNCWVYAGRASASLACLEDNGSLSPDEAHEVAVKQEVIDRIRSWADANGYND
jgi:hypothetical protein